MTFVLHGAAGLLPVFAFLAGLVLIDSYKLVGFRTVLASILAGVLAAAVGFGVNQGLFAVLDLEFSTFSRYVAPLVEETLKAAYLMILIRTARVGFLVDAAIHGFAIGAGFGFFENLAYLQAHPEASVWIWVVRGLGTAVMHGSTTAIFGMVSKALHDRRTSAGARALEVGLLAFVPGLGVAFALHSIYNHFFLHPLLATALQLLTFPLLTLVVFERSEKATGEWLGVGFDTDQELLEAMRSGSFPRTRVGRYLDSLRERFPAETMVDLFCLLQLHVELSIHAKGALLMREAGLDPGDDPSLEASFQELRHLEKSVGKAGLLAIDPFLHTSSRDLWQLNMLQRR